MDTCRFDEDVIDAIKKNKISGSILIRLSEKQMEKIIPAVGDLVVLMEMQDRIKDQVGNFGSVDYCIRCVTTVSQASTYLCNYGCTHASFFMLFIYAL